MKLFVDAYNDSFSLIIVVNMYFTYFFFQDAVQLQNFMREKKHEIEITQEYIDMRELLPVSHMHSLTSHWYSQT